MSRHEAAAALARTCSGLVAPAMIEPIPGVDGERAHRELVQRAPALLREGSERLDAVEALIVDLPALEPRARRSRLAAPVLPRQQAAREREVGDVRDAELPTEREHVRVVVALGAGCSGSGEP